MLRKKFAGTRTAEGKNDMPSGSDRDKTQNGKRMSHKAWLAGFAVLALAGFLAAAALVVYVDPFFQYHKPLSWFPYLVDNQVNQNPGLAKNMDYEAVLLGSSMTASFNTDWFGEVLGVKTQKLSYNGSYPKDLSNIMELVFAAKGDGVKQVFIAADQATFSADTQETKFPVTSYLYDNNLFNDVQYLFNKDVILNYILRPLADPKDRSDWSELYRPWWTDEYYNKTNVLMYYTPADQQEQAKPEDYYIEAVEKNLAQNICPYIEAHPETEFVFFYPPYSILFWYDVVREQELEAVVGRLSYMTQRLLSYENVRIFNFLGKEEIVCNLNNYADFMHYHRDTCRYITDCFADGENEVTKANYRESLEQVKKMAAEYAYERIWDDWQEPGPRFYADHAGPG